MSGKIVSLAIGDRELTLLKKNKEVIRNLSDISGRGDFTVTATHTGEFFVKMVCNASGSLRVLNKNLNIDYESVSFSGKWTLRLHGMCNKGDILQVFYIGAEANSTSEMAILY